MADYKEKYRRALKELDESEQKATDSIQALYQVLMSILKGVKGHHKAIDKAINSLPRNTPNGEGAPVEALSRVRDLVISYFDKDDLRSAITTLDILLENLKMSDVLGDDVEILQKDAAKIRTPNELKAFTRKVVNLIVGALFDNSGPSIKASLNGLKGDLTRQLGSLEALDAGLAESIKVAGLHKDIERIANLSDLSTFHKETFDVLGNGIVNKNELIVEFSGLVETVIHKLAELSSDLRQAGAEEADELKDRWRLTELMGGQVKTLQESVLQADNLALLKTLLTKRLAEFSQTVSEFTEVERRRVDEVEGYAFSVANKLKKMELQVQELKLSLIQAHEEALVDVLTGVANRRAFDERIRLEYERWKRNAEPLVLAVLDIDRFKKINDTYGHSVGDKVLCTISQLINKQVRESDFFGRIGGEEFAVIFTGSDLDSGLKRLEQFRKSVEDCKFGYQGKRLTITMSVGCAEFAPGDTVSDVYGRADQALYKAKSLGRNQCLSERAI
ncbi:GGDEF domain-containing protein [Cycloclasticus pugetii]|uniref:GGDEF domain-containing protein n=1 Tax=Cycloclasticus pugetii TaxID=34068 RepID=UPI00240A5DB7|nr:GGDEF domain-containing protein [Cycloclasticus pugetii]MDF1830585.1 GGDEF domain-containing protein [Cycloclasticus pugetii]